MANVEVTLLHCDSYIPQHAPTGLDVYPDELDTSSKVGAYDTYYDFVHMFPIIIIMCHFITKKRNLQTKKVKGEKYKVQSAKLQ